MPELFSGPVTPDEVPERYVELIATGLTTDFALSARDAIRRALAAVLTMAREDIATWISGDRSLTNTEISAVIRELDKGREGDPGAVYLDYGARLARVWPGGYGG